MKWVSLGRGTGNDEICFPWQLGRVVSFVGGGGKTTLIYHFAQTLAKIGKRVLVTTTTKIYMSRETFYANSPEEAEALWKRRKFAVIGRYLPDEGKLGSPEPELLEVLMKNADMVLIEADGSRHYPIKAPREKEPVIVPQTEVVAAVAGLSALGQPLRECCFGLEHAAALLGKLPEDRLTEEDAVCLLSSEAGGRKGVSGRKYCVILNQCDDEEGMKYAEAMASKLAEQGVCYVFASSFAQAEQRYYNQLANVNLKVHREIE